MSQLRQNLATKEWVIIASERARRPEDFVERARPRCHERPVHDERCPFCPGQEDQSEEVLRESDGNGGWRARLVKNRFPALQPEGDPERRHDGHLRSSTGFGYHEVLIETPRHHGCPATESEGQLALALSLLQLRGRQLADDHRLEHLIFFKNHGPRAGSSLAHAHGQLAALPVVPFGVRVRAEEARRHLDNTGRCVWCEIVQAELEQGERVVAQNERFVVFIPYAAYSPFHLWVVPRRHESSFLRATPEEMVDLAAALRRVLRKLYVGLGDPDFNWVLRTAPLRDEGRDSFHWYIAIVPRVSTSAGFELGTGMFINPSLPEESAAFLRSIDPGEAPDVS